MLISQIYHKHPITLQSDATVLEAVAKLRHDHVNGLIILKPNNKIAGVLSIQDIAAATVPRQFRSNVRMAAAMYKPGFFAEMCHSIKDKKVSTIMRRDFVSVSLSDNIMAVTADFLKNDLYIVPVIENGELLGIVTRSEIKTALWDAMQTHLADNQ